MIKSKNKIICSYGFSLTGTSHIKKGTPCQDAHKALKLKNGWVVAAIADGVGSAAHSEIASSIAVETVVEYINNCIDKCKIIDDVLPYMSLAYTEAQGIIEKIAEEKEDFIGDYDTTLSMIVYDGINVVYGHSGDGGIVGLENNGLFDKITSPQKAEDGICVIPLRAGEKSWEFGKAKGEYASVLLATDGIYDTFFPYLLKGQENEVYVPLIRYFMDNNGMNIDNKNVDKVKEEKQSFISSDAYSSVTDDKTLLVVVNSKVCPEFQNEDYYKEPDWDKLQLEWNKKAYPQLYVEKDTKEEENSDKKVEE